MAGDLGQFLEKVYPTEEDKKNFSTRLQEKVPLGACIYFDQKAPPADGTVVKLHCAELTFAYNRTTRLWPYPHVCCEILDDIVHGEFRTVDNPLTIMMRSDEGISYVKGMARACTLLTLLHGLDDAGLSPSWLSAQLQLSCAEISAVYRKFSTKAQAALENAKISSRLSITKMWDAITWMGVLLKLKEENPSLDASATIKTHNDASSGRSALVGSKRVAVLNLLDKIDREATEILINDIGMNGAQATAFTDDCWAHKKLLPGYSYPSPSPEWKARRTVTQESFKLFINHVMVVPPPR